MGHTEQWKGHVGRHVTTTRGCFMLPSLYFYTFRFQDKSSPKDSLVELNFNLKKNSHKQTWYISA